MERMGQCFANVVKSESQSRDLEMYFAILAVSECPRESLTLVHYSMRG